MKENSGQAELLVPVKTFSIRRSWKPGIAYEASWGKGSARKRFNLPQAVLVVLLSGTSGRSAMKWRDELARIEGVDPDQAAALLRFMRAEGLVLPQGDDQLSDGERRWIKLGWLDALQERWAEYGMVWKHDYTENPKVMTTYGGKNVTPNSSPPSPIFAEPALNQTVVYLPDPPELTKAWRSTLESRRTAHSFRDTEVTREDLSAVLSWTMRPRWSDGAAPQRVSQSYSRGDPFLAYIVTVGNPPEGCAPHTSYQYDSGSNVLVPMARNDATEWRDLLWGQDYIMGAQCSLVLVADWAQYMWKYRVPRAYRWVYTECGALMHSASLVASERGLRFWQSPAMNDARVRSILGHASQDLSPLYLAALGRPIKT